MAFLKNLFTLFYPISCLGCAEYLIQNERFICSSCRNQLPETGFCDLPNNPVEQMFQGRIPIEAGTALLFYAKKGITQNLIYHLKYKNQQDIGLFFGSWVGQELKESKRFHNIDGIVMVPLHPKKEKQRGYNQLDMFGQQLSKELNIPVYKNTLIKTGHSTSQTRKNRLKRLEKINEHFHIVDTKILQSKHILLIDDVLTTGATLEACSNELLKTPGLKISMATMVISQHI